MSSHDIDAAEVDVAAIGTKGYDAHIMLHKVTKGLESRGYITNCPEIMGSSGGQRECGDKQDSSDWESAGHSNKDRLTGINLEVWSVCPLLTT
eukprot:scaffold187_cov266-Chaetoceros_neogracile.AAC.65